ncbi:hypothetical protein ASZ90_015962 [hydrocarbon metagenome]|uniref:Uncharacterized protein n=1 Tax=hydrocarbon metagenome TaxID=938273 RepID=A0A0W8F0P4_9ZZZZ
MPWRSPRRKPQRNREQPRVSWKEFAQSQEMQSPHSGYGRFGRGISWRREGKLAKWG